MSVLAVVRETGWSTVQDGGRPGRAGIGVPLAGAWHRARYLAATSLLAGREDAACPAIELLGGRLAVRAEAPLIVAFQGPALGTIDGRNVSAGVGLQLDAESDLVLVHQGPGPVYLVLSGWDPLRILGSASTDTFSGLVPTELSAGQVLRGAPQPGVGPGAFLRSAESAHGRLRVIAQEQVLAGRGPWEVVSSARSGTRLVGGELPQAGALPSLPVVVGAIQATPSGEAIILGPDGALTGGYPVIGVVCSADIPRVSELQRGDRLEFTDISVEEAVRLHVEQQSRRVVMRPDDIGQDGSMAGG